MVIRDRLAAVKEVRASIESHRDLIVWQKSMDLAVTAYRFTNAFPVDERYGLTSQIRRSCASIPANIAEGYGRESAGAYAQQLKVAQGSLKEFETHVELAHRVGLLDLLSQPFSKTPKKSAKCCEV